MSNLAINQLPSYNGTISATDVFPLTQSPGSPGDHPAVQAPFSALSPLIRATTLAGLSLVNSPVVAGDTVLGGMGKLQGQVNALVTGVSSVFGRTGAVAAVNTDYSAVSNFAAKGFYAYGATAAGRLAMSYDEANITALLHATFSGFESELVINPSGAAVGINLPTGTHPVSVLDISDYGDLRVGEITTPPTNFTIGQKIYGKSDGHLYCMNAAGTETNLSAGAPSLWSVVSTSYLRPVAGSGYTGIRLYDANVIPNTVTISYESNGIYYNSSDTNALHRFWQTLQAEKDIILNTTGALTSSKGIQLATSVPNARFGYDSGDIRTNLADNTKSHIWSAGTIGSAVNNATLSGLGRFRVNNTLGAGAGEWAAAVFATTTGEPNVCIGYTEAVATIAAMSSDLTTFEHMQIKGPGKSLTLAFDNIYSNPLLVGGTLTATGATTLQSTLGVTGVTTATGGILTNTIGERTAANNIILTNKSIIRSDAVYTSPQLTIQGATSTTKQLKISYDTTINAAVFEAVTGAAWVPMYYNGNQHLFQISGGALPLSVTSTGIAVVGAATVSTTLGVTGLSTLSSVNSNLHSAISTSTWYGVVAGGTGGTNRIVAGNINNVAAFGAHNNLLNAWAALYLQPGITSPGVGICLFPGSGQTANASLHAGGTTILGCPTSAVADASHYASQISWSVNEGTNTLTFKVKYSDGTTVKGGSISLF